MIYWRRQATITKQMRSPDRYCECFAYGIGIMHIWTLEKGADALRELIATNNPVTLSFVESLLDGSDIHYLVLDKNMSILEGSLGIIPRRVMVEAGMLMSARALLEDAGLGEELSRN